MIRLVFVVCSFLLSLSYGQRPYFDYDPCEGEDVGRGYYNLAGERRYNRNVELVCDFNRLRSYDYGRDTVTVSLICFAATIGINY